MSQVRQNVASCGELEQMCGGRSLEHRKARGEGALSHLLHCGTCRCGAKVKNICSVQTRARSSLLVL